MIMVNHPLHQVALHNLGYQATVAAGQPTIVAGNLVYLDSAGEAKLADASTIAESVVVEWQLHRQVPVL